MDLKWLHKYASLLSTVLVMGVFVSCTPAPEGPISLAVFTENYVEISIQLEQTGAGTHVISATFTPPEGYHLYSKDIPITGVDGLGRPTLLELTSNSQTVATGTLIESAAAEVPDFGPSELLVYPASAVTLSLPVRLPPGDHWIEDELKVTYMACSASQCKPPVVGKVVQVRVPGAETFDRKGKQ